MRFANVGGRAAVVVRDDVFDLEELSGGVIPSDPMEVLTHHWRRIAQCAEAVQPGTGTKLMDADLAAPVPRPGSIFGLVANYPPATRPTPPLPMVFGKFSGSVCGPFDEIVLPDPTRLPMSAEWTVPEAELAAVIGAGGRHIGVEEAMARVAGFTVAQDITERVHEFGPRGSSVGTMDYASLKSLGKSLDTFCPLGPVLVTMDELADPHDLELTCRLNGEVVQQTSTAKLLFGVAELVSCLSSFVTLRAGDVILTGTPTPLGGSLPRLAPGDLIETHIAGIGTMSNRCVAGN